MSTQANAHISSFFFFFLMTILTLPTHSWFMSDAVSNRPRRRQRPEGDVDGEGRWLSSSKALVRMIPQTVRTDPAGKKRESGRITLEWTTGQDAEPDGESYVIIFFLYKHLFSPSFRKFD